MYRRNVLLNATVNRRRLRGTATSVCLFQKLLPNNRLE